MNTASQVGLVLVLLLNGAHANREPEPTFRVTGEAIEMGFCFGADYIVVYKSGPDGDLLLVNSSEAQSPSHRLSDKFTERVNVTTPILGLLGLEFHSLKPSDSGVYSRECWQAGELSRREKYHLTICLQEEDPQHVLLLPGGNANLWCNHTLGRQGTTIRWYRETYPEFIRTLFLDTSQSMEPLQQELKGHLQVRNNGSFLHITSTALKYSQSFYCMVLKGDNCLSYQKIELPEVDEPDFSKLVRLTGEAVTLSCSSEYTIPELLFWDTPFGIIEWNSETVQKVYKFDRENFGFVIPSLTEGHSGQYKCLSPLPVKEYSLTVCPKMDPISTPFKLGDRTILTCQTDQNELYSVQWYRRRGPESGDLLLDTKNPQFPHGLWGRMTVSQFDFSLVLFNLSVEDSGEYFCAVLNYTDYVIDSYDSDWTDITEHCVASRSHRLMYVDSVTSREIGSDMYTVYGALGGCVVLGVAVAITVYWVIRRKASQPFRDSSEQHQAFGGEPSEETACNQRSDPTLHSL